jgi:lysophospholipase L1-like esterase
MTVFAPMLSPYNARPGFYNLGPTSLFKWQTAKALTAAGTSRTKVVAIGDSTTVAYGAGTGTNNLTGARAKSWVEVVRAIIAARSGIGCRNDNIYGDYRIPSATPALVTLYDPRITFAGSAWSMNGLVTTIGHSQYYNNSTTDALTFTPTNACDAIDVWYVPSSGGGTFTVTDQSGTLATITTNGSVAIQKQTVTRTSSSNAINVQRTTGGQVYIAGLDCYSTSSPGITFANLGVYGTSAGIQADNTNPTWSFPTSLALYAPDLSIIDMSVNDQSNGTTQAAYSGYIQTIITAAKLSGDVILVYRNPINQTNPQLGPQYRDALLSLAIQNSCPFIDLNEAFAATYQSSLMFDGLHANAAGQQFKGRCIADLMTLYL